MHILISFNIPSILWWLLTLFISSNIILASPMAQWIKNLLVMQEIQEMWVQSLGREVPLQEEMAIHFSILAWEIPRTEEPGGLQSMGSQESDMT